jgi:hypothetical protein
MGKGFQPDNQYRKQQLEHRAAVREIHTRVLDQSRMIDPRATCEELQDRVTQLEHELLVLDGKHKAYEMAQSQYPHLIKHFESVLSNVMPGKNSYPPEMKNFYVLLSYAGQSFYQVLADLLGFPAYATALKWRSKVRIQMDLTPDSFNPTDENICENARRFMSECQDPELVVASDALSFNTWVRVRQNGIVDGLLNPPRLSEEEATALLANPADFEQFLKDNHESTINDAFVIYGNTLDPFGKSFPLAVVPAHSGSANDELVALLHRVRRLLEGLGIRVVGLSSDGESITSL